MTDFYSRNDVNYNGDVYSIPFPYIKEKEIQVFLDDTLFEDWFFLNDSQIKLRTIPQEVTSNTVVSVRRVTDIDKKVVTYTNNTLLNKENLNLSQDQLLYAVQEIYDNNIQNNIDIRAEVDEKVERVTEAVEKLDMLDDAVETAVNASIVAEEKAEIITQKEEELNQTIIQATQEIEQTYQTALEEINQQAGLEKAEIDNLSDDLKESIKDLKVLTTLKIGQIGIAPLGIDETLNMERYLNGQIVLQDQFKGFTQFLKRRIELYPSLACTESEWHTTVTMSAFSQCGKFVIDDNAGTIRLPKVVNIQGLTDLSKLGEIVEAGLPNIAGKLNYAVGVSTTPSNGALYSEASTGSTHAPGSYNFRQLGIDASRSNPIYGNSNTVQQEQIQYPYFIQVATGAEVEDNIINEIELNNPFSLLDYKFSEYELNNISWLRSNGQYNSKAIYPAVYDLLLKEYNNPDRFATFNKDAFTVVGSPTITDDGVASGFSSTSYIQPNYQLDMSVAETWELNFKIIMPSQSTTTKSIYASKASGSIKEDNLCIYNGRIQFNIGLNDGTRVSGTTSTFFEEGKEVYIKLKFTGERYEFFTSQNGVSWSLEKYHASNIKGLNRVRYMGVTTIPSYEYPLTDGSIDLKQFSITVDGKKVFSGANSKVKKTTETFTEYDFVLNTAEETFRLPIKVKLASGKAVVGNGMALGFMGSDGVTGLGYKGGLAVSNINPHIVLTTNSNGYGTPAGAASGGGGITAFSPTYLGITSDATKSGIETSDSDLYLYFYVGETVQNANLINAGRIEEKIASLITIVETYVNGTSGYNVYSNGYCEQWGMIQMNNAPGTLQLLKAYKDINFCVLLCCGSNTTGWPVAWTKNSFKTNSSFHFDGTGDSTKAERTIQINWKTCGYVR